MHDRLDPVGRFAWERVVRATDTTSTVKLVALTLATYGDRNGQRLRPGVDRLARACGLSERATRAALVTLRDLGLIERTVAGSTMGRRAIADEHRLTQPVADGTPAPPAGDEWAESSGSPARRSGDQHGSPAPGSGSPASDDRSPASDDRITGTTCTPSSPDHVMTKSSSWLGAAHVNGSAGGPGERPTGDDLAIAIAEENDWPVGHTLVVIRDILDRASTPPRSTRGYVRTAIRTEPDRYQPSRPRTGIPPHPFVLDPDDPGCADCAFPRANAVHTYVAGLPWEDR